jgi:AcrR family transcriptional regulator
MPRPVLSEEQIDARREAILDVAGELFESQGPEAVSLRRIAARAGCSPTTPYRYFASKEHVLVGLQIRAYHAIRQALENAAAAAPTARAALAAIAGAYIAFALERPETYALLFRNERTPEPSPELAAAKRRALGVCAEALAEAERRGELRLVTDPLTGAHVFWAAAHGAVSLHLADQLVVGRNLDDIVPTLIGTLMTGLTAAEPSP